MNLPTMLKYAVLYLCVTLRYFVAGNANNDQARLISFLFDGYEKDVRPVCETNEAVDVEVGIAIRQIIELDEPKQILYLNAWLRLTWYDCHFQWNASDYGNISNIIVPYGKVWVPDITLYDNAGDELAGLRDYLVNVQSTGRCDYNFPTVIEALCRIDVTYFPFDTQTCPLKFGSWAYHGNEVNTSNKNTQGDISSFVANTEWDLLKLPVTRNVLYYQCCPDPYPDVTFYVTMKRKPLFYVLNLLFPCLLITSVALLGFMLPPDAGEKVSLEITVLLSLAVFLLVVSEALPASSENFPYIGVYFAVAMLLVSLSTLLTVVVLNIHHKGDLNRPVPQWVRTLVFQYIGKIMFIKTEHSTIHPVKTVSHTEAGHGQRKLSTAAENKGYHHEPYINGYQDHQNKQHSSSNGNGPIQERPLGSEFTERRPSLAGTPHLHLEDASASSSESSQAYQPLLNILRHQLLLMEKDQIRKENKHRHDHMSSEWKKVGIVLDRLFLVLFTAIMVISSMGILLRLSS